MVLVKQDFDDVLFGHGGELFEDDFLEGEKKLEGMFGSIVEDVGWVILGLGDGLGLHVVIEIKKGG